MSALTSEQIAKARAMRPMPWAHIAATLGVTAHSLRCELEPGYRERRAEDCRRRRQCEGSRAVRHTVTSQHRVERNPIFDPNRDGYREATTPNQATLGDPLPGQSMLDRRARA